MRSSSSTSQLAKWDHQYVWHPFTQMREWERTPPVIIEKARGTYLVDTLGRKYLDGVSSLWVNIHGHRHPTLDRATRAQLNKVAHSTFLGLSNPPAILLARELIRLAPRGLTRVFYSDDGSTAVEVALKMAVQYWQQRQPQAGPKRTFLHLQLSYHGDTVGAMSVGGTELFHNRFGSLCFPSLAVEPPYCYRCPMKLTYPSCNMACMDPIEIILKERHADIAGVIVEPLVQAVAGMLTAPPGYLARLRKLCTDYNVLLIADEVATGFGRTGRMFACEHEGVTPDLLVLSKGLTGGYVPLAATLATEEIYRAFLGEYGEWKTFFHGHSYTGNPLACAIALANVQVFRKEQRLARMKRGVKLLKHLLTPISQMPRVGQVRQCGYMVGIELVQDRATKTSYPPTDRMGHRVAMEARQRGLLIRPIGNVLILMPPLVISARDLTRMVRILQESILVATESQSVRSRKEVSNEREAPVR